MVRDGEVEMPKLDMSVKEAENQSPQSDIRVGDADKLMSKPDMRLEEAAKLAPSPEITKEEAEKLWQYKMHEENIFYQRSNFFLVAESMLIAALASLFGASKAPLSLILAIAALGCVLTFIWLYVSSRQIVVINQIAKINESVVSVYARIRSERAKWPLSSTKLLAYWVPLVVMATWAAIILIMLFKEQT